MQPFPCSVASMHKEIQDLIFHYLVLPNPEMALEVNKLLPNFIYNLGGGTLFAYR